MFILYKNKNNYIIDSDNYTFNIDTINNNYSDSGSDTESTNSCDSDSTSDELSSEEDKIKIRGHPQGRGIEDSRETSMRSPTTCGTKSRPYKKRLIHTKINNQSIICTSKDRKQRLKKKKKYIVTSGELINDENNNILIKTYNFRMIFLLKKLKQLIKLQNYNISVKLKFNNWLDNGKYKPWHGFTIFFNYLSSDNTMCLSIRKDKLLILKEKYKGKYKTLLKEKYNEIKPGIYNINLFISVDKIYVNIRGPPEGMPRAGQNPASINSDNNEKKIIYICKNNIKSGSCGLRVDNCNINLLEYKIN